MISLGVDPGMREGGIALLDVPRRGKATVLAVELVRLAGRPDFYRAAQAYHSLALALQRKFGQAERRSCEVTQFMGPRSNSSQMRDLSLLAGCLCGLLAAEPTDPQAWRRHLCGQHGKFGTPAEAQVHGYLRVLGLEQQIPAMGKVHRGHLLDACGIAYVGATLQLAGTPDTVTAGVSAGANI